MVTDQKMDSASGSAACAEAWLAGDQRVTRQVCSEQSSLLCADLLHTS